MFLFTCILHGYCFTERLDDSVGSKVENLWLNTLSFHTPHGVEVCSDPLSSDLTNVIISQPSLQRTPVPSAEIPTFTA